MTSYAHLAHRFMEIAPIVRAMRGMAEIAFAPHDRIMDRSFLESFFLGGMAGIAETLTG